MTRFRIRCIGQSDCKKVSDSGPKLSSDVGNNCVLSNLTNPKPEKVSYYK